MFWSQVIATTNPASSVDRAGLHFQDAARLQRDQATSVLSYNGKRRQAARYRGIGSVSRIPQNTRLDSRSTYPNTFWAKMGVCAPPSPSSILATRFYKPFNASTATA